jgi:hypothetical protein
VDATFDKTAIASNLAFGNASAYTKFDAAGSGALNVYATGSDSTPVLSDVTGTGANTVYTGWVLGELSHAKLVITQETQFTPPSGDAGLRAVHGAYTAGTVDVYVTAPGTTLSSSVKPTIPAFTFGTVSGYLSVPAGTYEVQITATGTQTPVLITVPSVTLAAGSVSTAIAVDATDAQGSTPSLLLLAEPSVPTTF